MEPIENESAIIENERKNGDENIQEIFVETEIKLENIDIEEHSPRIADEKPDFQTLPNTDKDISYDESKPLHLVKVEEKAFDEKYLDKGGAVESKQ